MKNAYSFLTIMFCSCALYCGAQDLDKEVVKNLVDSARFVFVAQTMVPSGYSSRPIDFYYDVKISKDSVVTYLPYIGKAYTGIMPGETGVNFTSTSFTYKTKYKKKKWEVTILPTDTKEVKELHFTVFENGHSTLLLNPINKQSITYYGYLKTF